VGKTATVASVHEVMAVEPVIRRVVAARAANPADIDDLVQDCLERLLAAHGRLAPDAVLPYAIVTARNLVSSHATTAARRARATPRLLDVREPDRPEEMVLAGESRRAMTAALAALSPQERRDILAYYSDHSGPSASAPGPSAPGLNAPGASGRGVGAGALRVRMARTRAKLRLEYLLAFRHIELPTPVCYRVLLAISSGDTRRQRALNAGQHLLDCEACAELSEPLDRRSIALTAITLPGGLLAWAAAKARAQPAHAAASVAAGSAVVAVVAVLGPKVLTSPPHHPRPPIPSSPSSPAPTMVISQLSIAGRPVPQASARHSIRPMIGEQVRASGVNVESVASHNGFWVGTARARIWVELAGPLETLRVRPGDRLRFSGTVVGNNPSYPARIGVSGREGAGLLATQGAHLEVRTTRVSAEHER
jgi:RNA polymerase sigma factor (sigma-70 family)